MGMRGVFRVMGLRRFDDVVEGQKHDFTKVRVELPVSAKTGNEFGVSMAEWGYGPATNCGPVAAKYSFPCMVELEYEMTAKGAEVLSFGKAVPDVVAAKG